MHLEHVHTFKPWSCCGIILNSPKELAKHNAGHIQPLLDHLGHVPANKLPGPVRWQHLDHLGSVFCFECLLDESLVPHKRGQLYQTNEKGMNQVSFLPDLEQHMNGHMLQWVADGHRPDPSLARLVALDSNGVFKPCRYGKQAFQ